MTPELVVLLEKPLNVSVEFVQGGVQAAPHFNLPIDQADGTEFVTGEMPVFFLQHAGELWQIKFMPLPYFDQKCRPFVNGDPDALLAAVKGDDLKDAIETRGLRKPAAFEASQSPTSHVGRCDRSS